MNPIDITIGDTELAAVRDMVCSCIQCGTCTGSCPNAFAMDYTPRKMWRMVMTGQKDAIFNSRTFMLCSACYYCTLRCPRGLPLTEAMNTLKQMAARENLPKHRSGTLFYKKFMESVRCNGRVRETEFMTLYFISMMNPLIPLRFVTLGMRLMSRKKVSLKLPPIGGRPRLESIFQKAEELEEGK